MKEVLINSTSLETRLAIVEDGDLVEFLVEREAMRRLVGDVYLGRVNAILPGIQAAFVDIGRWWNFYQIALPWNINLNSVMFEIAICMFLYMIVLWMELVPPVLEKFGWGRFHKPYNKILFIIVALGIVLPTMHQSGLGAIIVGGLAVSTLFTLLLVPVLLSLGIDVAEIVTRRPVVEPMSGEPSLA